MKTINDNDNNDDIKKILLENSNISNNIENDEEIEKYMKMYNINLSENTKCYSKNTFDLNKFMDTYPVISGMTSKNKIYGIIYHLKQLIDNNIDGDIVELGCNIGTTSIFIQKFLEEYGSNKKLYCYDSPEGLPEIHEKDKNIYANRFNTGDLKFNENTFLKVFENFNLSLPVYKFISFKKIEDSMLPSKISMAFFDGVFYNNIMTSFDIVFDKISKHGIIIVDDVGSNETILDIDNPYPGAEYAIIDFLENCKETYTYDGYPNEQFMFDDIPHGGAKIIKL